MLSLFKLQHFQVLAETLNYAKAAEQLSLSQPALSRSIQSLEQELGIRLLDRSRSGVALTTAGRDLVVHTSDLLSRSLALEETAHALARGHGGRVAFGIGPVAAAFLIPKILQLLEKDLARVTLDIRTESPDVLADLLLRGEIDFFLARFPSTGVAPTIEVEWLNKTIPNAVVRKDHPLTHHTTLDIEKLRSFPRAGGHGFKEVLSRIPDPDRRAAYWPHIEYDAFRVLHDLAAQSDLVVFSAFHYVSPRFTTLRVPDLDASYLVSDVALFRLAGRTLSPATRRVQELVRDEYTQLS